MAVEIKPEYECFDGRPRGGTQYGEEGQKHLVAMQFNFVLGVPGPLVASIHNLLWLVNAIPDGSHLNCYRGGTV